jgi:hypothetical protein
MGRAAHPRAWSTRRSIPEAGTARPADAPSAARITSGTHPRDPFPGLRLLVRCEKGNGVTLVGLRLIPQSRHRRSHLFHPLTHLGTSRRVRALASRPGRAK